MALAPLATTADLTANGVDFTTGDARLDNLLAVASAVVRDAAWSPISEATSTVELVGRHFEQWLNLPGQPVRSVASVEIDGAAVSSYRLRGGRLWLCGGWSCDYGPSSVVVTMTHGLAEVPADIVHLVCALVGSGLAAGDAGLSSHGDVVAELDGDYQVTWAHGAEAVATAMDLPAAAVRRLRARFGGGASLVAYR